ncbi:UDP-glucuronosyltransferase 2C1-like [Diadema antillarum]|uniref:UDP-glucuronosyltransferase 2C1-like n=1 Tax=Diadema antillarum TaxID=105358 RepID=UPI003A8BC830
MARVSYLLAMGIACWLVLAGQSPGASGAKIMLAMNMVLNTVSQHILFSTITEPLVERGHEVILTAPENKFTKGLTEGATTGKIFYKNPRTKEEMEGIISGLNAAVIGFSQNSFRDVYREAMEKMAQITEGCVLLFKDADALRRLKEEKFDLIITMPVDGCDALLAEYLDVPFIAMTPLRRAPTFSEDIFGIPVPSSYVPFNGFLTYTDQMTFKERVINFVSRYVGDPLLRSMVFSRVRQIQREMGISPHLSLEQLLGKAQLWLCQSHFALEFAQPIAPNYVSIGGISVRPPKPLPQELEDFVQGSGEHGIIVFTLGSVVRSLMDDVLTEKLAKVFSELPQRVLWRYKGPTPRNLANNTLISDWLPQNDLLGHPKTRLLIYHGGANGIFEATKHGVPVLLMPLAGDQMANAVRFKAKGLGFPIDKNTLTEESFRQDVKEILTNPKYTINMKKASAIMNDEIVPTRQKIVYYVEHILKFGGDHLRSRALELNFIELNSIDVMAFLLVVSLIFIYAAKWFICNCCCARCCRRSNKMKSD